MIPITIDGQNIEVPPGTTVKKAAEFAGIHIPSLCNHPALKPYGACRMCVVEVEGARTLQASCTLPVFKGMVIRTNTPKVRMAREFVLTLIFSERNHFCMFCQKTDGDCELQNAAYGEGMTHWPIQPNWDPQLVDASHPYYVFDHNRCILCRRCVRACGELVGNFTLSLENRGASSHIVADSGKPLGDSTCIRCGTCVQVCPTGTLIDRRSAYIGKESKVEHVQSVCVECSVGCGINLLVSDNRVVRVDGDLNAPVNHGILCELGRYKSINGNQERINTPLVRKKDVLVETSWEEALKVASVNLVQARKVNGVKAIISPRLPSEAITLAGQLFSQGGSLTSLEERSSSLAFSSLVNGSLNEIDQSDCVMVVGADLIKEHQVVGFMVKRNLSRGTCLIVVDLGKNEMEKFSHYSLNPGLGTEKAFFIGLCAAIVTLGLSKETLPSSLTARDIANASKSCGVSQEILVSAARELACAQKPVFIIGKGFTGKMSADTEQALADLARMVKATAIIHLKGKANSQAALDANLNTPFNLRDCSVGYIILGDDTATDRLIEQAKDVPFLIVQASYKSPLTSQADIVLPVVIWTEQEGTYTNLDGRTQTAHAAVKAPELVRSNIDVLQSIANIMDQTVNVAA